MSRVLIVEDDPLVAAFVGKGLSAHDFETTVASSSAEALAVEESWRPDLVVLDIRLPDGSGLDVLRSLRQGGSTVPVIVLTGSGDQDVVTCLENGADDYMRKPFQFSELLARVRTRMRQEPRTGELVVGLLRLDLLTRVAETDDRQVELTAREFSLLEMLMRRAGQTLSRAELLEEVWGLTFDPGTNLVNVYVNTLRKKLGAHVIETVRGAGYRLPDPAGVEGLAAGR